MSGKDAHFTYNDIRRQSDIDMWQGGVCVFLNGKVQFRCDECFPSPDEGMVMEENPLVAPEWDRSLTIQCEGCRKPIEITKAAYWPFLEGQSETKRW